MKEGWPVGSRQVAGASKAGRLVGGLLDNSLVFYLFAFAAQRAWVILNSDVLHLVRRMH